MQAAANIARRRCGCSPGDGMILRAIHHSPATPARPLPHPSNYIGLHTHTHTRKGKTNLDFTEAIDSEWQWHQLGHMQVCTLLQTDNHTSTPPLCFYRPDALPAAQPTTSKH